MYVTYIWKKIFLTKMNDDELEDLRFLFNQDIDYNSDIEIDKDQLRTYMCILIEHTYKVKKFQITRLISNVIAEDKEKDEEEKRINMGWYLYDILGDEDYDIFRYLYDVNESNMNEIDTYVKLLLTYDKYNKLHILKHKTKLNNDIIFDTIIKYL